MITRLIQISEPMTSTQLAGARWTLFAAWTYEDERDKMSRLEDALKAVRDVVTQHEGSA